MHLRHQLRRAQALAMQVQRPEAKLEKIQQQSAVLLEEDMTSDLVAVMGEAQNEIQKLPESSFRRTFWEQQVQHQAIY